MKETPINKITNKQPERSNQLTVNYWYRLVRLNVKWWKTNSASGQVCDNQQTTFSPQLSWGNQSILPFMYFQMENQVVVSDYTQMDRVLREERQYILDICKKIKKAGCNVLLIQKSILRFVANRNSVSGNYSNNHYHSMFFSFLLIGQELTMRPANNCLQISVKLQIFCSCVIETMFLRKIQQVGSLSRQRVIWDI